MLLTLSTVELSMVSGGWLTECGEGGVDRRNALRGERVRR